MPEPSFIEMESQPLERYRGVLGEGFGAILDATEMGRAFFGDRILWQLNSTHLGGGVAEMLRAFLPYTRDVGVDTRWVVINGDPAFFEVTKRIHNKLHGHPGDGGSLGPAEREAYERITEESIGPLLPLVRPGDVVFLHDPQTAGLIPAFREAGAITVWRCHVGIDLANEHVEEAVGFLAPFVEQADAFVFSRDAYVWPELDRDRVHLMAPAIDAFSPKNQELHEDVVDGILGTIGLTDGKPDLPPTFVKTDGTEGEVTREAEILQESPLPAGAPLVVQISRWDVLKDHEGLLECFIGHLADTDAHLALVGPSSKGVSDDPEGPAVQARIAETWIGLDPSVRSRIHIISLPMDDFDENGVMVNAIQRRADIVVQKSLVEGFGLTVSEAMWKRRPVVASAVGGINDQIVDGISGFLVEDPHDLSALAARIRLLLDDPGLALTIGEAARERVADRFLAAPRLAEYLGVIEQARRYSENGSS